MQAGPNPQKQSISLGIICAGILLLFCLMTIIPNRSLMQELDQTYVETQAHIAEQAILVPFFKNLVGRIHLADPGDMKLPKQKAVSRSDVVALSKDFEALTQKTGLVMESFVPIFSSPQGSSLGMQVSVAVSGPFDRFRPFLLQMVRLPYVKATEKIHIEAAAERKIMELTLRIAEKQPM